MSDPDYDHDDDGDLDLDLDLALARRASGDLDELAEAAAAVGRSAGARHIEANEQNAGKGIAKLVLSLVELIRQLLEKQALRRMDAGSLSDEQIERMGETFLKLADKVAELKSAFDLDDEELDLGLGSVRDLSDLSDVREGGRR